MRYDCSTAGGTAAQPSLYRLYRRHGHEAVDTACCIDVHSLYICWRLGAGQSSDLFADASSSRVSCFRQSYDSGLRSYFIGSGIEAESREKLLETILENRFIVDISI